MTLVKDLLRRRVPQVMAVYLGACWGLLEFTDFITQRFALSPHLIDLALVGPLLLLPSVILVTYFHGAPGQDSWVKAERIGIPVNLVVAGVFLVFFFQGKDLGAATTTVVVTDEEGVETERVVPKEEFRKRITVYFFDAEPADTAAAWLRYGLPMAILNDLNQDHFFDLRMPMLFGDRLREAGFERLVDVPLPLAREIAEELHRDHFVMGTINTVAEGFHATISLFETGRGRLVEEREYQGSDLMEMADEISAQLRYDLKIPDLGEDGAPDLPVADVLTHSPTAYRLSIEATVASGVERDFARAASLLEEAVAEDPTYAGAQFTLANLYTYTNRAAEVGAPMQAAMDHLYRLPERDRFVVKSNYYFMIRQDMEKALAALDMWADLFPDDLQAHQARLQMQVVTDDKEGALASLERIIELDPAQRDVLLQIGSSQEGMGDFAAAEEAYLQYAEEFPNNHEVLARLAGLAQRSGDLEGARHYFDRALVLSPSDVGLMVGSANVEAMSGRLEDAREQYEVATESAGTPEERAQAYAALEAYFLTLGQTGKSIEYFEMRMAEAPSFQPELLVAQLKLQGAGTYAVAGREEDAFALVEEARAGMAPPFDGLWPVGALDIYLVLEDAAGIDATLPALEAFITELQYEILRPAFVRFQGAIRELRGEYREAIERYEEEKRLSPSSTSVSRRLGRCHRELGEYDESVALLQEALRAAPFGPRTNYELALTYEAMNRMDEARIHLNRALEVWSDADPEYKWAQRAREAAERMGG